MATKTTKRRTAPEDMESLAAELGVPVKEGRVTSARDRYFLTIGKTKKEIRVGEIIDLPQIKSLAGRRVAVIVRGGNIVAIGRATWRPPIIVCYVPAPDFTKRIRPELQAVILDAHVRSGVISPSLAKRLRLQR
jgi:hypothetical protein